MGRGNKIQQRVDLVNITREEINARTKHPPPPKKKKITKYIYTEIKVIKCTLVITNKCKKQNHIKQEIKHTKASRQTGQRYTA